MPATIEPIPGVDWPAVDVLCGCPDQAGDGNRTLGRVAVLPVGLPGSAIKLPRRAGRNRVEPPSLEHDRRADPIAHHRPRQIL